MFSGNHSPQLCSWKGRRGWIERIEKVSAMWIRLTRGLLSPAGCPHRLAPDSGAPAAPAVRRAGPSPCVA